MCSFLVTSWLISNLAAGLLEWRWWLHVSPSMELEAVNFFLLPRGPDGGVLNCTFCLNLDLFEFENAWNEII